MSVRTDLTVTGRPAQFGRGVMAEVGDKLVGQFAECLSEQLGATAQDGQLGATKPDGRLDVPMLSGRPNSPTASVRSESEPIDLMRVAGVPVATRAAVAAAAAVMVGVVFLRLRRRRHGS